MELIEQKPFKVNGVEVLEQKYKCGHIRFVIGAKDLLEYRDIEKYMDNEGYEGVKFWGRIIY
jgi:hypothetical protein